MSMVNPQSFTTRWIQKPLSEVVDFLDNLRKPVTKSNRVEGDYPYYGANGIQGTINDYIFDEPLLLLAEDGGNFDDPDRDIAYIAEGKYWVNNHAHVLRPKSGLDLNFLFRVLARYDVTSFINGATRAKLTKSAASKIPIPLPPLAEQKRIAGILDKADELRRKQQKALDLCDQFLKALFIDLFGDPSLNPKEWPKSELVQLCKNPNDIKCGPFGTQLSKSEYQEEGVPLWGIKQVNKKFLIDTPEYLTMDKASELDQYSIIPGDLVMTRKGTVGNCAVYPDNLPLGIMHSDVLRARFSPNKCNPVFMQFNLVICRDVEFQIQGISTGAIMAGINVTKLKNIIVITPPIELQNKFAEIVKKTEAKKAKLQRALDRLNDNFNALSQRAFKGEL